MTEKKVLVILAQGLEEIEAITPIDLLRRAGIEVTTAGLDSREIHGAHGITLLADTTLDTIIIKEFDALILPGGQPGTTNLVNSEAIVSIVREAFSLDKLCCAICAAPLVFDVAGILDSQRYTCYPGIEQNITNGQHTKELVVANNKMITSQAVGTAQAFSLAIIERLCGRETGEEIAMKICYKA